jgi:hypothetical protein
MEGRVDRKLRWTIVCLVGALQTLLGTYPRVCAQGPVATAWSVPNRISDLSSTVGGSLVTGDSVGNVYVVWFGNSEGKGQDQVNTVYYRHWDGTQWSPSIDILAGAPGGPWLRVDRLVLDAYGRLLLLWHQDRNLVLSVADPSEAERASNWRSVPLVRFELMYGSDLIAGSDGVLHVLAAGQGQDVYYLRSVDGGRTWSTSRVSSGSDPARQYSLASLAQDGSGSLYATWTEFGEDNNWSVTGVYFSRSKDNGRTWSEPEALVRAPGHGYSTVVALGDSTHSVMVFWNRAVGSVDGRYYALSHDDGETWDEPQVAYQRVSGLTRPPYLFVDSLGQLHMIGAGYDALTSVGGEQIWYSGWDSSRWTAPELINVAGTPMTGNEVFDARLVGGNRLLYTWTDAATKDIWFTNQNLPGPSLPEIRLELPTPVAATPVAQASVATITATSEPGPSPTGLALYAPQQTTWTNPLVAGVVPAALLVAAVIVLTVRRRSGR